ncbi:MAG: MBL fold metallo-hydrolase [Candidatus Micrarchaeota archaeon]|nr:MBL fold metallo-hydrolase [Candidatus Micrarchaeota archaeon]
MQRITAAVNCKAVEKLRTHPLVEPVTNNTFIIKGGWANGFIFLPDAADNKCVIIDPGTSEKLEGLYRKRYISAILGVVEKEGIEIEAILQVKEERRVFLRRVVSELNYGHGEGDEIRKIFLERSSELLKLIKECGLDVTMVLATHHHIDHLGIGHDLANKLGIRCYLPKPDIFETDKLRDLYPIAHISGNYERIDLGTGPYNIKVWDISGHTNMVSFLLPDGSLIVGDLVCSKGMWDCSVLYMEDVRRHLTSLHVIGGLLASYNRILLSHGTKYILAKKETLELVKINLERVEAARAIAQQIEDNVTAAETYLGLDNGHVASIEHLGHALVTARHIGEYRK